MAPVVGSKTDRTYLRSESEPQAIRDSRSQSDNDRGSRARRYENYHSSKRDIGQHRRTSHSISRQPYFILDIVCQPPAIIQLGAPIQVDLLTSIGLPSYNVVNGADDIDVSSLFAVVSLVADSRSRERMPLEAGYLTGQKLFDSVHAIPHDCLDLRPPDQACRALLGYLSFPYLIIRQAGTYRLRITLLQMSGAAATSLLCIDSELIRVERRNVYSQRRQA